MKKISRDTPLSEITLRKYEKPYNLGKRELVRKLCMSIGILQPGDSRDIIIDILYILLQVRKEKKKISSEDIRNNVIELRKELNLEISGTASSNVRRQLKRLRDIFLVEKVKNRYRITENESLQFLYTEKLEKYIIQSISERIKNYFSKVDEEFNSSKITTK